MINKKTVLVLGAGASMDYGFPSGEQLLQDIINILAGPLLDYNKKVVKIWIASIACRYFENKMKGKNLDVHVFYDAVSEFQEKFIRSNTASIDDFIDKIPESKEELKVIGKILIFLSISRYENEQRLIYKNEKIDVSHRYYEELGENGGEIISLVRGWYGYLWRKIYEGSIAENLKNLTIISFNYDRSLEQYLHSSLVGMSQLQAESCEDILNGNLFIHHVYGKLGKLSWQNEVAAINDYFPFKINSDGFLAVRTENLSASQIRFDCSSLIGNSGATRDLIDKICDIVSEIRTYKESITETNIVESVKLRLSKCEDLFFLGFGYHQENMKWFDPKGLSGNSGLICAGTTYGIGKQILIDIKGNRLRKVLSPVSVGSMNRNIKPEFSKCNIQEYFEEVKPIC